MGIGGSIAFWRLCSRFNFCSGSTANAPANRQMPIASVVMRQCKKKKNNCFTTRIEFEIKKLNLLMKTTEEYSKDYFDKLNELSSKGEQWRIRVTHEEFLLEIERIRAYEIDMRKSEHLNEYHIQRNVEGMISVMLMEGVTIEEAREQYEMLRKTSEVFFAEEAPEIKLRLEQIQTPLSHRDTVNIYNWISRKQITIEMLSEAVFSEFAKTKHYEMIIINDKENSI